MMVSGWPMGIHPMKGEWRSAKMELGAPCAMTCGMHQMPWWPVDSWDFLA